LLGWDPKAKTLPISGHGCIASSASGIFIGQIPAVGVVARKGLAAINVTTGILTDWQPSIAYSGTVYALCRSSDTLFVGGRFGGFSQAHSGMVAVSVSDGALLNWNPGFSNYMDEVRTIIKSGNTIFAGGKFSSVGGYLRKGLVAIDAATLTVTTWNPIVSNGTGLPDITAMTEYAGKLYVAGNFDAINGIPRSRLASIDVATAQPATFSPSMTGNVNTLFASGNTLYVGGSYGSILGQPRTSLAAIDMTADTLLPWNPAISSNGFPKVLTLHTQGSSVYCGGEFSHMNGLPRNNLAVVNATGALQGTSADISGSVYAINSQGQTVFAGGSFLSLSNPRINNMTAFIDCPGEVQINYTGPGSFCGGSAASLLVAGGSIGAAGYDLQWNLNGSPIPGATDTSYLAIDGGSYTVSLSNGLACPVKISLPEFLTVKPTPDPSFASGGPLQFCEGGSVLMSAAHPGAGITFTWLKNGAYLGGGDTKTIKNTGSYNLVAKQNGCNDTSASFTVTAYPLPIASLSTTDSTTICSGDQVGLLASPDYPGFTYYWKNGSTFTDTTAIAGYNTGTAGTYKIMVMDTMGCVSKLSTSKVKVIVKQAPIASITAIGSTTLTSSTNVKLKAMPKTGATWQWTLDGTPITGATANQFIASASGDYAVEITVNGCTDTAAAVTVIQTGQRTPDEDMPFIATSGSEILTVYPNPANRALNISTTDSDQEGLLQMMDMGGRLIKSYRIKGYLTIDVASLTTGIYLLKYNSDNGNVSMTRFVKD
ncbi:MAG: T9SS type A sorting domain-containing protein, partial [Sphingobacteriales bacterium]